MSFLEILINGTKCNRHGYNVDALLEEAPLLIASLAISLVVLGLIVAKKLWNRLMYRYRS